MHSVLTALAMLSLALFHSLANTVKEQKLPGQLGLACAMPVAGRSVPMNWCWQFQLAEKFLLVPLMPPDTVVLEKKAVSTA